MPKVKKPLVLVALVAAAFAISLDTTIVNVALPALVRQLHATDTELQWVVDAYNLVFAALVLVSGNLSDRWGRKGVLLAGLGVFGAAAFLGAVAASADELIAARAVMGVGAAMIFPSTLSLVTNVFTGRAERAQAIGAWGASAGAAIALGPVVGGWLLAHSDWSAVFWAMVPVALGAAALVGLFVPTSRDPRKGALDGTGFLASVLAMGLLVYSVIEAPSAGWASARTLAGFAGAALVLVAFVAWERRATSPMLDVRLFLNRRFSAASGSVTLSEFTLFGFIFLITQYFQFVRSYSPLATGIRLLPVAMSVGASSVVGTKLAVRFGTKEVVTAGLALVTAFYAWVALSIATGTSYGVIAGQMVVYGVGLGLTQAPATESIMGAVAKDKAGAGSAVNDATRLLGGTLGVAVIGSVFASLYTSRLGTLVPRALPGTLRHVAAQSVGAAYTVASRLGSAGDGRLGLALHRAASSSFVHAVAVACVLAGGVAAAGALAAALALPAQPPSGGAGATADIESEAPAPLEAPALPLPLLREVA
jgi:EmrB/QacA subfamily drug resistance transporter